jgi:hypothetical protein
VGPRTGLDGCRKISPPPGFDPGTVQPVASHCTDHASPVQLNLTSSFSINGIFSTVGIMVDRPCGLVVRVSGYRYRGLGFDSRRYQIF